MRRIIIATFIFSLALITACHKKTRTARIACGHNPTITKLNNNDTSQIKMVIVDRNINMSDTGTAYTIDSVKINNDILSLFVNYSGGCKTHSFELLSNGAYAKSLPPQVSISLKHIGNDDACRQLITQELKFNVSKLKYQGQNTVILNLRNKARIYYVTQ